MEPRERILVYLRVRAGERVLARSKVRELRALANLLADFMTEGALASREEVPEGATVAVEYVDATTDLALVGFSADAGTLVVSGKIPLAYRERMLGRGTDGAGVSRRAFEERASAKVGEEGARELADAVFKPRDVDLIRLIERAIDSEGNFSVRLPMP